MYLPKSKYQVKAAKPGEFKSSNGQDYVGPIVETFTGACYPGTDPVTMGPQLTKVGTKDGQRSLGFYNIKRIPTEVEYQTGQMIRYFAQEAKTKKVIELSPETFASADIADLSWTFRSVRWTLTGRKEDVYANNQDIIQRMERAMPGIVSSRVLFDPYQFYREK